MKDKEQNQKQKPRQDECASETETEDARQLKPVRPKIGEQKDNLKQRSDWFQKRSGKR